MERKFKDEEKCKKRIYIMPIQKCEKFTSSLTADFFK